ncbi:DUF1045 domain-containing protein [Marinibaculum pumilum]|uniref:DUF1045 domain-containing protein n=1 Tax=Marinibaculum pumilum TaxID=1766165 RepID=A0ABV7L291_9PROT
MRYAIYYAPPAQHPLHALGSAWLGRDALTGAAAAQPATRLPPEELAAVTRSPRRYGFHATLAPPLQLARGRDIAGLEAAVAALAARTDPFSLPLELGSIQGFLALRPAARLPEVDALAAACVEVAEDFRAPPGEAELARRRAAGLTPRQEALLQRWGYPYVMDEFRFHMTLSERLEEPRRSRVLAALQAHFAGALDRPVSLDALTIFAEPAPGGPFHHHRRFPFLAGSDAGAVRNMRHA